ncbi:hypothetical protein LGZ99_03780 [Photorhabdus temperata]|uniref:Uncharacterized protein n=1 Tax=Photorhabdus temperata subsp. temperata Meg1 TaxID=1393735 RepID=A0A081RZ23_PHOTE|nr:hypothetical protein [Photorhabdus temperata]KER03926.1 hypothetical protein MEG1DRAFT_01451 [Photorhabdus temperata subsp. temperata Meg1]MCT8346355.1 hypothetical protein [Photorhabdus temperata]
MNKSPSQVTIQIRDKENTTKHISEANLEKRINRSLRASFALAGNKVSDESWKKMSKAAQFLTKIN